MLQMGDSVQLDPKECSSYGWVFKGKLDWDKIYTIAEMVEFHAEPNGEHVLTNVALAEKPNYWLDVRWLVQVQPVLS
jgi:hypothetical protein